MALARPTSDQFIQAASVIRENYSSATANDKSKNPDRFLLIDILETLHDYVKEIKSSTNAPNEDELQEICFSIWVFCFESIKLEYGVLSPERSRLYQIFLAELKKIGIDYKTLEEKYNLLSIEKFHNFVFDKKNPAPLNALKNKNIDGNKIKQKSIKCIQAVLKRMFEAINNIVHGIPSEETIDFYMSQMDEEYKKCKEEIKNQSYLSSFYSLFASENPNRKFYTQLCMAVASIHINERKLLDDELSRSHNIKNGLLLLLRHCIDNEYSWRSSSNSGFYNACKKILNCTDVENLSPEQKALAIATLQNFFNHTPYREYLQEYGSEKFGKENVLKGIDLKIVAFDSELTYLINFFLNNQNNNNWPITSAISKLGETIGSILGYGSGWSSGTLASQTNGFLQPKLFLGDAMSSAGTAIVGSAGGHLGFLAAAYTITSTTAYALALILQQTGMIIGKATGAAIGFPVDLSVKGIQATARYFFHLYENTEPTLLKNVDADIIQCLLRLPSETFSNDKQNRLKFITDNNTTPKLEFNNESKQAPTLKATYS